MLREGFLGGQQRQFIFALIAACVSVAVVGCSNDETHYITVNELRSHHQVYLGEEVVLKGYLSGRYAEAHGSPYLFATSDDAIMRNQPAAVFIDLYGNAWVTDISDCMEKFVQVRGIFRVTDNPYNPGLAVTDIESLWILPPSDDGLNVYCVGPAPADWEVEESKE
ncbi:MAG: hypothetical protein ACXIUB_01740 [Wenzhouxiangella sp.]